MPEYEGKLQAPKDTRIGIVVGRFNEISTRNLLEGCKNGLTRCGVKEKDIDTAWVPGAVEIPLIAQKMGESGKYDALICIGCVMQGASKHFDFVAGQVSSGVGSLNLSLKMPVIFAVLTVDTLEQALERSGSIVGNKGFEAALTAVEMLSLMTLLDR